jgi:hypothetical protein
VIGRIIHPPCSLLQRGVSGQGCVLGTAYNECSSYRMRVELFTLHTATQFNSINFYPSKGSQPSMDALAILGACLACLGMLSSGISNLANTADAYWNYEEQSLDYARRYARYQANLQEWKMRWSEHPPINQVTRVATVVPALEDIRVLTSEIRRQVEEAENEAPEGQNVPVINSNRWTGRFRGVIGPLQEKWVKRRRGRSSTITRRAMHSLFKKGLMEGWLTRLEKAIEDIEKSSEMTLRARTGANWAEGSAYARNREATKAEQFMSMLTESVESLRQECIAGPCTGDWVLGLRPPEHLRSVAVWEFLVDINLELRFRHETTPARDIWELKTCYMMDNEETHDFRGKIRPMLPTTNRANVPGNVNVTNTICTRQDTSIERAGSIGSLLIEKPHYFTTESWRLGVTDHVRGIVNWALLLWETKWFESLCCFGLHMESNQGTNHCMMLVGECTPGQNHEHVAQRLQNLGITIAQIILARPLRLTNHGTGTKFEQRDEAGTWKEVQPKRLASDILSESKSIVLARAIEFCLTDSRFETNGFQKGYLMEYIKHIYDP